MQCRRLHHQNEFLKTLKTVPEFVNALKQCSKAKDLELGKRLHKDAVIAGLHIDKFVACALITMYTKCSSMQCARKVFDQMSYRDAAMWNCLVRGYVENGESSLALDMLASMDCEPDSFTYVVALKACGNLASQRESMKQVCLEKGISVHKQVRQRGFDSDIIVASTLVDMYRKCGSMQLAREVFDRMLQWNVVTWNSLVLGYVENGDSSVALGLFDTKFCPPASSTYTAAAKACGALASKYESQKHVYLDKGVTLHKEVKEHGFVSDMVLENTLVDMYSKCGSMQYAREVFDRMVHKDVVSWTNLILGYAENGENSEAMNLFISMDCEPDSFAYVAALKACGGLASEQASERQFCLEKGMDIHKRVKERGFDSNVIVGNTLVYMYSKCGRMQLAREVFDRMTHRNVVTWNCLIVGYLENGESSVALELFVNMDCEPDSFTYIAALKACIGLASADSVYLEKGVAIHKQVKERGYDSNVVVASTLVDMYSKYRIMQPARDVFEKMVDKNVVTWTCLIVGYLENGESYKAMELFTNMDCEPDSFTFAAALKACGSLTAVLDGKWIHGRVCRLGLIEEDPAVGNALVDFYGKCGSMTRAEELFNSVQCPDIVAWTSLIAGYSSVGDSYRVFRLAKKMEEAGVKIDDVTFTCILTACSHVGKVEQGKRYFESMCKYGITPSLEHYNCLIDMLGRDNRIEEALEVARNMPFKANAVTWKCLLGACSKWKNVKVGKVAFDALVACGGDDGAAYVLMADIYSTEEKTQVVGY